MTFTGSVRADSVVLALSLEAHTNLTVEERVCGEHWYSASINSSSRETRVISLSPYTCYQFRTVQYREACSPLLSPPSDPVQSLSSGLASSPPAILAIRQLPRLNINITFHKPDTVNGKM